MPNVTHDLCGKIIPSEQLLAHRLKCYVKDVAYGFNDPQTGAPMVALNGKIQPAQQPSAPQIVMEPSEEDA